MTSNVSAARSATPLSAALISIAACLAACTSVAAADGERLPLSYDPSGRPVVSARLNDEADFDFMVDTAAQRTAIGAPIIDGLSLEPAPGMRARISGVAGHRTVPMYPLERIAVGGRVVEDGVYTSLTGEHDAGGHGHDAILGQDVFADSSIVFDWTGGTVEFGADRGYRFTEAVPARMVYGGFFLIPVRVNGVEATALVDTGAAESFANPALLAAMPATGAALEETQAVMGVSQHEIDRLEGQSAEIVVASATLGAGPLTIIDSPTFTTFGLAEEPALVLGMDRLRSLPGFALDYDQAVFRVLE